MSYDVRQSHMLGTIAESETGLQKLKASEIQNVDRTERIQIRRQRAEARIVSRSKKAIEKERATVTELLQESLSGNVDKEIENSLKIINEIEKREWNDIQKIQDAYTENLKKVLAEQKCRKEACFNEVGKIQKECQKLLNFQNDKTKAILLLECPVELCSAFREINAFSFASNQFLNDAKRRLEVDSYHYDKEFTSNLRERENNISQIIEAMRDQYNTLQNSYREHLNKIIDTMSTERSKRMAEQKEEIEQLFGKRRNWEEHEIIDRRQKRFEYLVQNLENQFLDEEEQYIKRKSCLEKNVQTLEQHLEKMVAAYQLNKEKLEYNLEVLKERNKENTSLLLQYKNKSNKLREILSKIIRKSNDLEEKYKHENFQHAEEFKRSRAVFQQMQRTCLHFKTLDESKFRRVWRINEIEIHNLVRSIQKMNKFIFEQHLDMPLIGDGINVDWDNLGGESSSESAITTFKSSSSSGSEFPKNLESTSGKLTNENRNISDLSNGSGEKGFFSRSRFSSMKVKKVLDLVSVTCNFLLESKLKERSDEVSEKHQELAEIYYILRHIGVDCQDDLDILVGIFYRGQDDDDETLYVDADDVLRLVEDFMEEKRNNCLADILSDDKSKNMHQQRRIETEAERLQRQKREIKRYWEKFENVIPEKCLRIWKGCQEALGLYIKLLKSRAEELHHFKHAGSKVTQL